MKQKIIDLFNLKHASIDIETTGRDAKSDKIWNIGIVDSDGNTKNIFVAKKNMTDKEKAELKAQLEGNLFGQKQAKAGSFNEFWEAVNKGLTHTEEEAAHEIANFFKSSKDNGTRFILGQNLLFENQFLTPLLQQHGLYEDVAKSIEHRSSYTHGNAGFLYIPPEATTSKALGNKAFEEYLLRQDPATFTQVAEHYRNVLNHSINAIEGSKLLSNIDNMDLTKALYATAAEKGLLDPRNVHIGTSLEFLLQAMYDRSEKHTGVADALDTLEVAKNKSIKLFSNLLSDNLTGEDRTLLAKISDLQARSHNLQFIGGLKTGLEEFTTLAGYRLSGQRVIKTIAGKVSDSTGRDTPFKVFRQPDKTFINKDTVLEGKENIDAVIDDIVGASKRRLQISDSDIREIRKLLDQHKTVEDKIAKLYELTDNYWKGVFDKPSQTQSGTPNLIPEHEEPKTGFFKSLSGPQKVLTGLAIAGGAYIALSNSENSKQTIKDIKKRREYNERKYDLDSNIRIYSKLDNYHGSGFATWNERTKHHEY